MIISFHNQFVFFAIPKTATQSIRMALRPILGDKDWEQCTLLDKKYFPVAALARIGHGHISGRQIQPYLLPVQWEGYFKFCFVRHPVDRFLSAFFFLNRNHREMEKDAPGRIRRMLESEKQMNHLLFRPQYTFVSDDQGNLVVDFVGKYECLQDDFNKVCQRLGMAPMVLEKVNQSARRPLEGLLEPDLLLRLGQYYRRDFELFGYDEKYM